MSSERIDVIATKISGSIQDWSKVERIVPLFAGHGFDAVNLVAVGRHAEARAAARNAIAAGGRTIISAGGSGTFNAVLEGCCDSGVSLAEIRLGFLRKGSADLIGKVLGMPDEIEPAIAVFANAIRNDITEPCDVLLAESPQACLPPRHFVGYGGAEIFGRIPHFTENRLTKWYKGVLSQVFGDLGPFSTGMALAIMEKLIRSPFRGRREWRIEVDGVEAGGGRYQALIIVNGNLGRDLPYSDQPLGSGGFELFALRDLGVRKLLGQARRARAGTIMAEADRWGMERYRASESLVLAPRGGGAFPANVDGATLFANGELRIRIVDRIRLISASPRGREPEE